MKKLLYAVLPFTVLLGSILIAIGTANINGFSIVEEHYLIIGNYQWNYYTINIQQYLANINNALVEQNIGGLFVEYPKAPQPNFNELIGGLKYIANILIFVLNNVVYVINWVVIVPTKILIYPINLIITLLGLNTSNNIWVNAITSIYDWQIPNVPYI